MSEVPLEFPPHDTRGVLRNTTEVPCLCGKLFAKLTMGLLAVKAFTVVDTKVAAKAQTP